MGYIRGRAINNSAGQSLVQVIPTPTGFAYVDNGRLVIPEPASMAVVGLALLGLATAARQRRRRG